MTISTSLWYNRATTAMQTLAGKTDALSTQISTGKKLQQASDDPVAYSQLRNLAVATADSAAYAKNLDTAATVLSSADTALTSIGAQITRAKELALQANNGTLTPTDRAPIAEELMGIVESLANLGNATDSRGLALFGDSNGTAGVTKAADGSYSFASGTVSTIPIANGQVVQPSTAAVRIFAFGGTNILETLTDLAVAMKTGGELGDAGSDALSKIETAANQVNTVQASIGARGARVELEQTVQSKAATQREIDRSTLEDTDVTAAITELQKTMTILSATQASFTKLQSLSLFDYLK